MTARKTHTTTEAAPIATTVVTGELAEYEVDGPSGPITLLLTEADAKAAGAKAVPRPANKAITPQTK